MLFNSLAFLIFFPIVAILYFVIPYRYRWLWLLAASYYFYMSWRPIYILLILFSTFIDYFVCRQLEKTDLLYARKILLAFSILVNLGTLLIFKYAMFFGQSLQYTFDYFGIAYRIPAYELLLPVGISFYTFQTLSYTIDVYNRKIKAEHHLGIFALFVSFFPQLVAGPIERSGRLLPQFYQHHRFNYARVTSGLRLMAWGLFKKIVIADRISRLVGYAYANYENVPGVALTVATVLFAFQIYCDFSGYSDIAIGAARIMGFKLMNNFRQPYFSRSIPEFWHRWHISLSTWFRDYLYIPLGGSRVSIVRWQSNMLLVFLISGLWHGANWTFVIWGAIHGLLYLVNTLSRKYFQTSQLFKSTYLSIFKYVQVPLTFTLVCFAWIFFRSQTLSQAFTIVAKLHTEWGWALGNILQMHIGRVALQMTRWLHSSYAEFLVLFLSLLILFGVEAYQQYGPLQYRFTLLPTPIRWATYYGFITVILIFGFYYDGEQPFIYFQF